MTSKQLMTTSCGRPRLPGTSCLSVGRRHGEAIRIGRDIRVSIYQIGSDAVRLAIEAPPHVSVHREEIFEAIEAKQEKQAGSVPA